MIVKKLGWLFFFISLLLVSKAFACHCSPPKFTEKYTESDFVAIAKITKVYKNEGEEEIYKADISIKNLFKGQNLESVYIKGRSDESRGSSCSIFIPENTELIIYARKINNRFSFGSCSGYLILNQKGIYQERTQAREIEMLNLLKARNINFTSKIWFGKKMGFSEDLVRFQGVVLKKSFTIYEITFASDLSVKSVDLISGFENEIDSTLSEILKKSSWLSVDVKSEHSIIKDKVPEGSKILVAFYYYPAEKGYKSFVSEHDV